ncbi:hypothetical protein PHYPSEUDO_005941 [Phytophthora pseudosyringae]|uniref:Uncharacterized protein n=1 Tax=Phytophthora pseudosyringae TaxID=221518 RepID=A0A8T1VN88_9STRA|nr:hypothetical protein PHYPSEUDO_005941 [Phytophthora pseudosyringae]
MNAASVLSSLYFSASASSLCSLEADKQQQPAGEPTPVSKPKANSTATTLAAPIGNAAKTASVSASSSYPAETAAGPTDLDIDGYSTPKSKMENQNQTQEMPSPSPMSATGKRKRLDMDDDLTSFITPTPTKRKASSDFLRKGQWTSTEERLARLLIEAFEEGYLPIYTGIRLRGYLAVQLQCDPMRVSKKLCAGAIDGKQVPKNYGQKKFKLRKKSLWDSEEAACRIVELERLTRALWTEARMRKPSFLTLSSTRNLNKRRGSDDEDDSMSSPPSPARTRTPSSTPKTKKQKAFPIIYLNLSKLKRYKGRGDSSDSDPASPSNNSDSDSEPVRLDGESLQAAYDLLTLCSPRGSSSKRKSKKGKNKKDAAKKVSPAEETPSEVNTLETKTNTEGKSSSSEDNPSTDKAAIPIKGEPTEIPCQDKFDAANSSQDSSGEGKPIEKTSVAGEDTVKEIPSEATSTTDISTKYKSKQGVSVKSEPSTSSA